MPQNPRQGLSIHAAGESVGGEGVAQIMKRMEEYGGKLPFNDKADPEVIKQEFGLSKNAFKRAVGRLLKEGHIKISEKNIEMKKK